jgi:putative PIN family toxin of toxin-antitoxin system
LRIVVDTNVLMSGLFFGGWPYRVLEAWRDGRVEIVISVAIFEEYREVGQRLALRFSGVDPGPFLDLLSVEGLFVEAPDLPAPVCSDHADDKFLACALAGGAKFIVSGDRALQRISGYRQIEIVSPRRFVEAFLREQ